VPLAALPTTASGRQVRAAICRSTFVMGVGAGGGWARGFMRLDQSEHERCMTSGSGIWATKRRLERCTHFRMEGLRSRSLSSRQGGQHSPAHPLDEYLTQFRVLSMRCVDGIHRAFGTRRCAEHKQIVHGHLVGDHGATSLIKSRSMSERNEECASRLTWLLSGGRERIESDSRRSGRVAVSRLDNEDRRPRRVAPPLHKRARCLAR